MRNGPYELVLAPPGYPGMRYRGKYCYEHHLVWWQHTGGTIAPGEVIHHVDEDKRHNVFSNLEKMTRGDHTAEHAKPPEMMEVVCALCGRMFPMLARKFRDKLRTFGHSDRCCGRSCQIKKMWRDRKNIGGS